MLDITSFGLCKRIDLAKFTFRANEVYSAISVNHRYGNSMEYKVLKSEIEIRTQVNLTVVL